MNARRTLVVAALAATLAACGGAGATSVPTSASAQKPSPTPVATPPVPSGAEATTSASPRPSPTPFDHGVIPAELTGRWAMDGPGGRWHLHLNADGEFAIFNAADELDVRGLFGVFDDTIAFLDTAVGIGGFCGRAPYMYRWAMAADGLGLERIQDDCSDRWTEFSPDGLEREP
jgi:ABC-type transport system substrate-binding protein